tara:strand:+ start:1637 stop:3004 length:1368 start_codon:yes stop_codon:yes gene_type:complete
MKEIKWKWVHKRNSSLHHMSLLVKGLHGKGFLPEANFFLKNQIVIGKEDGCYIFYDEDELNQKLKDIQQSILEKGFVEKFREKQDLIFEELFVVCKKIENSDFGKFSILELKRLVEEFTEKITKGPLISVQLWGIDACWDDEFILMEELRGKDDLVKLKGILSQSSGKSVAFSERESFLNVALQKKLLQKHIDNFNWVDSEYVGRRKSFSEWKELLSKEKNPENSLKKLYIQYENALAEKENAIKEIGFSGEALLVLEALNAFVAQRDWAKGKFCYALSVYDTLLIEISKRLNISKEFILNLDIDSFLLLLDKNFGLVSIDGKISVKDGDNIVHEAGLIDVFSKVEGKDKVKGVGARHGKVEGKVRVITNASDIDHFQEGEILVTYMTTMEFTPLFKKAVGIVCDEGSLSSHAAIIAREFGIPCIVGTQEGTKVFKTGDLVELDGSKGIVELLKH